MLQEERQVSKTPVGQWYLMLAIAMTVPIGAISIYSLAQFRSMPQSPAPKSTNSTPAIVAVTALGRLEPEGEVTRLSAASAVEGARVDKLLVNEGDKVRAGQVVAILDGHDRRLAALEQAKQQVKVAQGRLAKVKQGAQVGEITAQKAEIARLQAELRGQIPAQNATIARLQAELLNAEAEDRRHQALYKEGAISASLYDSKRLPVETVRQQLNEAKATLSRTVQSFQEQISQAEATLNATAEVRPVDVQVAQAEVDSAIASVKQAQAELNLTYVRSPIDSKILKIYTRTGELVSNQGIADIGQTDQMYAVGEIYETDIGKVRLGQKAIVTSEAFSEKLQGEVTHIGLQVDKQNIFNVNPLSDTDNKVVEVKIRLADPADSRRVAGLTNLQVEVAIDI